MRYREASAHDVEAIAALHAESWRAHYRGTYPDSFLDGEVFADRRAAWTRQLSCVGPKQYTVLAQREGVLLGFAHTVVEHDPVWGSLLENLHVRHDVKRLGIGKGLLAQTARAILGRGSSNGLYLWVLEQNSAARAFYEAQGASCVERELTGLPGGGHAWSRRYAWRDVCTLERRA